MTKCLEPRASPCHVVGRLSRCSLTASEAGAVPGVTQLASHSAWHEAQRQSNEVP